MREHGRIQTTLWDSEKFNKLGDDYLSKLIYNYLLACPHGNSIGCYKIKPAYLAADMRIKAEEAEAALLKLDKISLIGWDKDRYLVLIYNHLSLNPIKNKDHFKGALKALDGLPECELKIKAINELIANVQGQKWFDPAMMEGLIKPENNKFADTHVDKSVTYKKTETETETETETDNNNNVAISDGLLDDTTEKIIDKEPIEDQTRDAFEIFQKAAEHFGWPCPSRLTEPRRRQLKARLKDADGLEGWRQALARAGRSDFLSGRKTDWKIGLDWVLKPSNFTKLAEGNYDNGGPPGVGSTLPFSPAKDQPSEWEKHAEFAAENGRLPRHVADRLDECPADIRARIDQALEDAA